MYFRATALLGVTAALNAAMLLAGTETSANDWPHWRGPQRNGISTERGWNAELPAGGPKVLWTAKVGLGYSSIAVVGDRAYTLGNSDGKDTVYCLDAASGRVVWQHSYAHPVDAKYYSGGASATPTVEGGRVYTLARRGQIHCLDAATGAVKWKKNLAEELGAKIPEWGFAGSVLIDGDRAVVNVGTYGTALDKNTGKVLWKTGTAASGYATPVPFEQDGRRLYLIFAAKELVAVHPDTGRKAWSHEWETSYDVNAADPIIAGPDRIFIASGYDRGGALLRVKGDSASVVWENKNIRSQFNAGVLVDGHLYAIDGNTGKARLRCVDLATGNVAWTFDDPNHGALMVADGRLIVISEKGELMIGTASPGGFKPSARAQISGGTFWTVPVLSGGRIFLRNSAGLVTCIDV